MATYYVNKNAQNNGDHEVHRSGCDHLPEPVNRLHLGDFDRCQPAVREAKSTIPSQMGGTTAPMTATRPETSASSSSLLLREGFAIKPF